MSCGALLLLSLACAHVSAALDGSRYMWFTQPGRWPTFEEGMPIGNGRIGATIYGGGAEVVGINENSIWTGPFQDRTPLNATEIEPVVRELLLNGNITEGNVLTMAQMIPTNNSPRAYSYFGNVNLDFGHPDVDMSNYLRWLDTKEGIAGVSYSINGVNYTREYVASYPQGVLVARFKASRRGALNINATMTRIKDIKSLSANVAKGNNTLTLIGTSGQSESEDPIEWTGEARFKSDTGMFNVSGSSLLIHNATTLEMYFDVETNFRYTSRDAREKEMRKKINNAYTLGYDAVRAAAVADTKSLLDRVTLDLGTSPNGWASLPTDQRISIARNTSADVQLTVLIFNFGRHLLVASSRSTDNATSLPANLQGIWNNSTSAPWGGKYTININIEMNYWPAGPTNLIETQEPLFDLMAVADARGQALAKRMYGCPGTVFHHNLDLWGDPAPTDNYTASTMWPMGAAWLAWHMMDHYRFTGDTTFLGEVAYPFFVKVAAFYECYTFPYQGYQVTGPSLSPENNFYVPADETVAGAAQSVDVAPAMDNQLMTEVFRSLLDAASILGINGTAVQTAKAFLPLIQPPLIGSLGQILEWRKEYKEKAIGQKHLSPLWALMPGRQFSPLLNSTLGTAAEVLLDRRVSHRSGTTGWSRTWLINQYARVFRGDDAWEQLTQWFAVYPTPYNLYNTNEGPVGPYQFQIDGNFGFVSGVTEMLLQSHAGITHLLPALPSALPKGSVAGLVARGNFVVDIQWEAGKLVHANITSRAGGELQLRCMNGSSVAINGQGYTGPVRTKVGETYVVTPV
ncbi:glycoside hydrolase family 95 protein [Aspergillus aculeatinus CBS 121060]|uniref:Glycoside hydrolase family 95 protein n=1 Tax=Aspergillus aculeatinus CBS 121060 TaxID=1448322 RepID=A0ACD1GTS9_9EURO|nr:glycoside hydrolase family 95 protein [Aspergillus aculeatinus CBS 121060]RAH64746.1 glycoside hydrolase family 95 protein [Aspergillus aculeatinus CBS 121060]